MAVSSTAGEALRHYFEKYPHTKYPRKVVDALLRKNPEWGHTVSRAALLNEARVIKCDVNKKLNRVGAAPVRLPSNGAFVRDIHRLVWDDVAPMWLRDAIIQAARDRDLDWSFAARGKVKEGQCVCRLAGTPHVIVFYPTTGRIFVYAGKRDLHPEESFEFANLIRDRLIACVYRLETVSSEEKHDCLGDLIGFMSRLLKNPSSIHVPFQYPGAENLKPGKISVPENGVTLKINDGTDKGTIEVEVRKSEAEKRLNNLESSLKDIGQLRADVSDLKAVIPELTSTLKTFVAKLKEMGGEDRAEPQRAMDAADGRRYS